MVHICLGLVTSPKKSVSCVCKCGKLFTSIQYALITILPLQSCWYCYKNLSKCTVFWEMMMMIIISCIKKIIRFFRSVLYDPQFLRPILRKIQPKDRVSKKLWPLSRIGWYWSVSIIIPSYPAREGELLEFGAYVYLFNDESSLEYKNPLLVSSMTLDF